MCRTATRMEKSTRGLGRGVTESPNPLNDSTRKKTALSSPWLQYNTLVLALVLVVFTFWKRAYAKKLIYK